MSPRAGQRTGADEDGKLLVSRRVGYAHVLKAPPAYSFGTKHERRNNDPGPGPGAYEPDSWGEFHRKGAGFGASTRSRLKDNGVPGPNEYQPTGSHLKSASAYTFRSKSSGGQGHKSPGPDAYQAGSSKDNIKPRGPAVSISHRHPPHKADATPGPNTYDPDFRVKEEVGVSLKFRHESVPEDAGPGPGQYAVARAYSSPPGKSFGVSRNDAHLDNGVPGPIYSMEPSMQATRPRRTAWTIGRASRDARLDNGVPGPGTYGVHAPVVDRPAGHSVKSQEGSAPAYSIPGKPYISRAEPMPGPSDYNPRDTLRKSAPAFSIHGADQKDSRRHYPGPGHYATEEVGAIKLTQPAISLSHRHATRAFRPNPGPGAYNPDFSAKEHPGVSIKFRHAHGAVHETPAPHDYADKDFKSQGGCSCKRRGYSFGVRHKVYTQDAVPGPQYEVGCSTLGISAAQRLPKAQLPLTVVL